MVDVINDPLAQLIVDTEELDRKRLTELLNGYCVISKHGDIRPVTNYSTLDTTSKILTVLLAQKAVNALGFSDTDQISPKKVESISGLPGSTIRNKLIEMRQLRIVDNFNGNYSVPNHTILQINLKTLDPSQGKTTVTKPKAQSIRKSKVNSEDIEKLLKIDQSQIGEQRLNLLLSSGKYLEKALAILSIAREQGVESLTPGEITQFLKQKIRVNIIRENISLALGRGTRYVDRFQAGKNGAYGYKIMVAGEKLLEEALKELQKNNK